MNAKSGLFTRKNFLPLMVLGGIVAIAGGCGQLYRVTPLPRVGGEDGKIGVEMGRLAGLSISAVALDGDRTLEHFEGNLPMAGVLAIEVRVRNQGTTALPMESIRFGVDDAGAKRCSPLRPEKALRRVMKFYGNRIYQIEAHLETVAAYQRMEMRQTGEIAAGEELHGLLFFEIVRQAPLTGGYSLVVSHAGESVRIRLPAGSPGGSWTGGDR
jgi:hypothetical protein